MPQNQTEFIDYIRSDRKEMGKQGRLLFKQVPFSILYVQSYQIGMPLINSGMHIFLSIIFFGLSFFYLFLVEG